MENFKYAGESMETSIPWSNLRKCVKNLEILWKSEMRKRNMEKPGCDLSYRISQVYHDGVCLYLYFAISFDDIDVVLKSICDLKNLIMKTIIECGGAISHHHGIGKKYKSQYIKFASSNKIEFDILQMVKKKLDPKNIFAVGNSFSSDEPKLRHKL